MIEERKKELRKEFGLFDDADQEDMLWAIIDKLSEMSRKQNDLIRYLSTIRITQD